MRTVYTGSASCLDEQGKSMKMDYYITVKEIGLSAFGLESYGIRIEQEREGCKSAAQCDDITLSGSEIDLIAHMLQKGTVTPIALEDVVAEIV